MSVISVETDQQILLFVGFIGLVLEKLSAPELPLSIEEGEWFTRRSVGCKKRRKGGSELQVARREGGGGARREGRSKEKQLRKGVFMVLWKCAENKATQKATPDPPCKKRRKGQRVDETQKRGGGGERERRKRVASWKTMLVGFK